MKFQLRQSFCLARLRLIPAQPPLHPLPVHPLIKSATTAPLKQFLGCSFATKAQTVPQTSVSTKISVAFYQTYLLPSTKDSLATAESSTHSSNLTYTASAAALLAALLGVGFFFWDQGSAVEISDFQDLEALADVMAQQLPPGRPGNLTPEEEEKLRKLWQAIFQLCGVADEDAPSDTLDVKEDVSAGSDEPKKKGRFGMFRKNKDGKSGTATPEPKDTEDDKYGQTKHFYETVAKESPEVIRQTIWSMVKHDHPDALVLRFLRARKWDVDRALVMLVSTMHWRQSEMGVDIDIIKNGEAGAAEDEKNGSEHAKKLGHDFQEQIRMGKSFLHGTDKMGRPICVVRVRLHKQGEQCEESLERYTVYLIETARMFLRPPVDTATIVFDMTGFSLANMDYTPVKFMIKCFEANYPESLGAVLVHKAPWVFQGFWKIIRGWLDPVVASKIHFTNNKGELEEFIEPSHIIKELEGDENWEYKYVEPIPGENDKMKDTATRDQLLQARADQVKEFEHATREWIRNPEGANAKEIKAQREKLAVQLREGYWNLDPYLRARTLYDRQGVLAGEKTNWYSPVPPQPSTQAQTSADDLD